MATTATAKPVKTKQLDRESIQLKDTLLAIQLARTGKNLSDASLHPKLDAALKECKAQQKGTELVLMRALLHIMDVSRQHNILRRLGIKSDKGGAQERANGRSILRWMAKKMPKVFYDNLEIWVEFTNYGNLWYNQIRTERYGSAGRAKSNETQSFDVNKVAAFVAQQIRKGQDLELIAKFLPAYKTGKNRRRKVTITKDQDWNTKDRVNPKVNGQPVSGTVTVKLGDIITYSRPIGKDALARIARDKQIINAVRGAMDWTTVQYKEFRKKQNTAEQKFSSGEVADLTREEFYQLLDKLPSGQQYRVARMIVNKDRFGHLTPVDKWGSLGEWYIQWQQRQSDAAQEIRDAKASGDVVAQKAAEKKLKVKATGLQTIDLLAEMLSDKTSGQEIDNLYEALMKKMDFDVPVFPILDGSGSMRSSIAGYNPGLPPSYRGITMFDIAATMGVVFATNNPEPSLQCTFGWFSSDFKPVNHAVEGFSYGWTQSRRTTTATKQQVLRIKDSFSQNLARMRQSNGPVSNTNAGAAVEYFVKLVQKGQLHVEQLPRVLLFITDSEWNTGMSPSEFVARAMDIGWMPLFIGWSLQSGRTLFPNSDNVGNILNIGGFSEGVLTQIVRGIKNGSVHPQDELWALYDDPRYSVLK